PAIRDLNSVSALPRASLAFFSTDPATTTIYTLSLHDALPISTGETRGLALEPGAKPAGRLARSQPGRRSGHQRTRGRVASGQPCRWLRASHAEQPASPGSDPRTRRAPPRASARGPGSGAPGRSLGATLPCPLRQRDRHD